MNKIRAGSSNPYPSLMMSNLAIESTLRLGQFPFIERVMSFRLVRTAIAIEKYRLSAGKLPASLDALVPEYL